MVELTEGWWANFSLSQTAGGLSDMHHERYFGRSMQAADGPLLSSCPSRLYAPTTANIKEMWTHYWVVIKVTHFPFVFFLQDYVFTYTVNGQPLKFQGVSVSV